MNCWCKVGGYISRMPGLAAAGQDDGSPIHPAFPGMSRMCLGWMVGTASVKKPQRLNKRLWLRILCISPSPSNAPPSLPERRKLPADRRHCFPSARSGREFRNENSTMTISSWIPLETLETLETGRRHHCVRAAERPRDFAFIWAVEPVEEGDDPEKIGPPKGPIDVFQGSDDPLFRRQHLR